MYIQTQQDIKVISNGTLWSYYLAKIRNTDSEAMILVYTNQLRFLNEDRYRYYKIKGIL